MFSQRPVRRSFSIRSIMKTSRLGDRTLAASGRCPPDASGHVEKMKAVLTGLWLCLVGVHRTRPIMILEELDLSGIDRTLGGSVRSLPPERPVNRNHADYKLFLYLLFNPAGDPFIIAHHPDLASYPR